jgi:hypothetical protein
LHRWPAVKRCRPRNSRQRWTAGIGLAALRSGGEALGLALDATGVGAIGGVPLIIVSATGIAAGGTTAMAACAPRSPAAEVPERIRSLLQRSGPADRAHRARRFLPRSGWLVTMDLKFAGQRVTAQDPGYSVALVFGAGASGEGHSSECYEVRIETPFSLHLPGGDLEVTPGETDLPDLIGRVVTVARADDDGGLRIDFQEGSRLLVAADPDYEAWTVAGPDGFTVVSEPGGGLAVWSV